jgi:hypothetical protein
MLKNQLAVATHITRKGGPWVVLTTSILVIANDLKKNR